MRVLITGGAGFIGSHVADRLLGRGDHVLVVDNYATGRRDNLTPSQNLTLVEGTIADGALVQRLFREFAPDRVVHAAASYKDPLNWAEDSATNVVGTAHVVQAAQQAGVGRLLYFQTALCYGLHPLEQPITLQHPLRPGASSYAISKTAGEVFIPLTVGGGLRSLEDIRAALVAGADKVALNTAAINRPELIREAARRFGSSAIAISIEAIRKRDGTYEAYTDNGRQPTSVDAAKWAVRAAELGAGEILVTSIDREGTGEGFDIELTRRIAETVPIPVVACGGAGTGAHVAEVISAGRADAVCLASMLHYNVVRRYGSGEGFSEGNTDYLRKPRRVSKIQDMTLPEIKEYLIRQKIACRPPAAQRIQV